MSSPEGERSPKRQRRSYSPASPPVSGDTKAAIVQQPQTPPPSVHMSPSWQSQPLPGLQYAGQGNGGSGSGSVNGGSVTFLTPPSTAGLQSQMMARGASSEGGSAAQTPAYVRSEGAGDGDAEMRDVKEESQGGDVVMAAGDADADTDAEHRRTDHERHEALDMLPPLPTVHALYKLPTQSTQPSQPHPSQNLIQLYSLQRIQASVARRDPVTGEKAVKLRKSYEGKVKELGIEGRNKATKSEDILTGLVDPAWSIMLPEGKTWWQNSDLCNPPLDENRLAVDEHGLESALLNDRFPDLLSQALDMRPGHLPANEHRNWKSLLGLDEPLNGTTTTAGGAVRAANAATPLPNGPSTATTTTKAGSLLSSTSRLTTQPASVLRNSAPASPHTVNRPDRAGKKRRYDESSYAGYAEGYEDDGYSTGGGMEDRRGSAGRRGSGSAGNKRQKRKVSGRQPGFYQQIFEDE